MDKRHFSEEPSKYSNVVNKLAIFTLELSQYDGR